MPDEERIVALQVQLEQIKSEALDQKLHIVTQRREIERLETENARMLSGKKAPKDAVKQAMRSLAKMAEQERELGAARLEASVRPMSSRRRSAQSQQSLHSRIAKLEREKVEAPSLRREDSFVVVEGRSSIHTCAT